IDCAHLSGGRNDESLLGTVFFACVALVMSAEGNQGETAKDELKNMEGTWLLVMSEQDGMQSDPNFVKNSKMIIKGNSMTVYGGKVKSSEATITLNPAKKPKTIDASQTYGGPKGTKYLGIYELDGDTLRICFGEKQRPKDFTAKKGSKRASDVWKRAAD